MCNFVNLKIGIWLVIGFIFFVWRKCLFLVSRFLVLGKIYINYEYLFWSVFF